MKNLLLLFLAVVLAACHNSTENSTTSFVLGRGTNLAHWLSQSQLRGEARATFITENDFEQIAELGFEHVRLPIDEEQMWDEQGNRHPEAFALMDSCIVWSMKYQLCVVVDLHILRSHHFNHGEKPLWTDRSEQEKFFDLWRDLSAALKKYPTTRVAYELMNEAVADDHDEWNRLLAEAFDVIRELEPTRIIVIGSNRWQSVDTFDALKVPENDSNIILSFHFYEPFLLTHYKASWTSIKEYEGAVHYPGVILKADEMKDLSEKQLEIAQGWADREFTGLELEKMMAKPIAKAKTLNLPLYCGEFGVFQEAPRDDLLRWYQDMVAIFERNAIGWANWNYKSDQFGLVNRDGSRDNDLIEVLLPPKE